MVAAVLLCPGQGAQFVGMGEDLASEFSQARAVFEEIDDALGMDLSHIMWEGPESELTLTHNAQPAILAHTLAVYAVVKHVLDVKCGAGHSLGEYSAYVAAGSLSVADAARLVRKRGELMFQAGSQRPGTMTAVIGLDIERVKEICLATSDGGVVVAANLNAPDQTVLSGDPEAVGAAGKKCKEAGAKRVMALRVSGAFHSPLMEPARVGLMTELKHVQFADPAFPIIANASAEPVRNSAAARDMLGAQLTAPVRWVESMSRAAGEAGEGARFIEMGPAKVLCGLLCRIVPDATSQNLSTAADIQGFLEVLG
jgi:[acyl-carrier-protein] S-malonyltransferase